MADYLVNLWVTAVPAYDRGWGDVRASEWSYAVDRCADTCAQLHPPLKLVIAASSGEEALKEGLKQYLAQLNQPTPWVTVNPPNWINIGGFHYIITGMTSLQGGGLVNDLVTVNLPSGGAKLLVYRSIAGLSQLKA